MKVVADFEEKDWNPNRANTGEAMKALAAFTRLGDDVKPGTWLLPEGAEAPGLTVSCGNALVEVDTRIARPHTAAFFNTYSLGFDYDPHATCDRWRGFLESVWKDDEESKQLLQEWFGYVISGRTDLQKIMFLKGASRGGKGVMSRVLRKLMGGERNVAGPTFKSFADGFGLETLVDKPLAIIGDARSSAKVDMQQVIEKILSITGEDLLDVDVKYKAHWQGAIPTRLVMLANELPWFRDDSGALMNRMLILVLTESFAGREDLQLEPDLERELAGIFNWALDGLDRLKERGWRFTEPAASRALHQDMADALSPLSRFIREHVTQGDGLRWEKDHLYLMYVDWCERTGESALKKNGRHSFGPKLNDAIPKLTDQKVTLPDGRRVTAYGGIEYHA